MFNSYSSSSSRTNVDIVNKFNYDINAVSGTIRKSHPKSKITMVPLDDTLLDKVNPRYVLTQQERVSYDEWFTQPFRHDWGSYITKETEYPVIVLQVMLCGENKCLVEFVKTDEFFESEVPNEVQGEVSQCPTP